MAHETLYPSTNPVVSRALIDSGIAGLILGTAYMVAGRNLWACILTHGFIDTFAVIDAFFGWSK